MKERTILHIDMNNFYASVECLYNEELKNVPMAVAGDPTKRHGIILAKNALAKEKGVKTAETIWQAERKCPGLILVPPRFERYEKYSKFAYSIYCDYTDRVESFGLDECWLDVTGSKLLFGSGMDIAEKIKSRIKSELGLTVSIGVSFNKIFSKLASDMKKPDAITEITKENFMEKVWPLPTSDLLFVGKSTFKTLANYGIHTIGDIAKVPKSTLIKLMGKQGEKLFEYANGVDDSPVNLTSNQREIKSIGNSTTLPKDIKTEHEVKPVIMELSEQVAYRLRKHGLWANCIGISVKTSSLESYQKSSSLSCSCADSETIYKKALELFRNCKENSPIRSLGVRAEKLSVEPTIQCSFFSDTDFEKNMKLEKAKDYLRKKYGNDSVKRAILFEGEKDD